MKLPIRAIDFFVFGNFFIAFCAAAMVLVTYLLNGVTDGSVLLTIFVANSTFLLYNFHRFAYDVRLDSILGFFSSLQSIRFKSYEKVIVFLSLITEVTLCFFLQFNTLVALFCIAIPAIWYSVPFPGRVKRLRELPAVKMPLLAFVWAFSTVLIPALDSHLPLDLFLWSQFFARWLFVFALCVPFELRDVEFDRSKLVRTIPVVLGEARTKWLGLLAVLAELAIHQLQFRSNYIDSNKLIVLIVTSIIAAVWIIFYGKLKGKYFYKLLVDGTMILRFLLMLFLQR